MTRSTFRLIFYVTCSKEKNGIVPLLVCSQAKVEKSQVRKVVQECWTLVPASNSLSYTTYQYDYNRECHYSPVRRIGRNITHHFSFGERFDETMMKCYFVCYQHIMLPNHQFIEFSPLNKSAGEVTVVNITIRRLVGRTSVLLTDKGKPMSLAKRKRQPMSADTAAGFWKQKAIAH